MDVREKLVKLLSVDCCPNDGCDFCDYAEFEGCRPHFLADHLIANGVTVQSGNDINVPSKWIPMAERLPEVVSIHKRRRSTIKKSIRVLCVCAQKSGKTMVKEGYCEWYNDYPEPRWQIPGTIDEVTHWMPLPEPPKGE